MKCAYSDCDEPAPAGDICHRCTANDLQHEIKRLGKEVSRLKSDRTLHLEVFNAARMLLFESRNSRVFEMMHARLKTAVERWQSRCDEAP